MKIYNKLVIDIESGDILYEDSFEYDGPIALCKGGGSTTTNTQDPVYNARMAAIAEQEQAMAQEYFNFWKSDYKPLEMAQIQANLGLMPAQTALAGEQIATERSLLEPRASLERKTLAAGESELEARQPVMQKFYSEALGGVNVGERMGMAETDVMSTFSKAQDEQSRALARRGVTPGSGAYASQTGTTLLNRAKAAAGARTTARVGAETEMFDRLRVATGR